MHEHYQLVALKSWEEVARAFYGGEEKQKDGPYARAVSHAFATLGEAIRENKKAKGWTITTPDAWLNENQIPADLALIHSEVSEALEAFRESNVEGLASELADIVIRVIGLADGLEFDLGAEILRKIEKNRTREHKHGGKRI
jgi:NTP pyrophosphatase (non-canonical NTP hydrolase)